jgi:hypothetical protein
MLLKEAIAYYSTNSSPVYCVMLDATKAFKRADYCNLFRVIMKHNLPTIYTHFMPNIYSTLIMSHVRYGKVLVLIFFMSLTALNRGYHQSDFVLMGYCENYAQAAPGATLVTFFSLSFSLC